MYFELRDIASCNSMQYSLFIITKNQSFLYTKYTADILILLLLLFK
jgi:hypothetical protein